MDWHTLTAAETAREVKSDCSKGLSEKAAQALLRKNGENKLTEKKQRGLLLSFFSQFTDFMVIILLVAAAVSFVTSVIGGERDYIDSIVILIIVNLNAAIGTVQESRAQKALDALKKMSAAHTSVLRDGKRRRIDSKDVVRGDLLYLCAGDLVPADARIVESSSLKTRESALTGESMPCEKSAAAVITAECPLGERANMLFSSSVILTGRCTALVCETGMETQIGKIAQLLSSEKAPMTPLQLRLAKISKLLGIGSVVICAFIFLLGLLNDTAPLDSFMLSVSLAVAAIPEGLPAIVTVVLSIGVQAMAKSNAIVRRLPTVETLGAATYICSDKTGTLTQNKMTVTNLFLPSGECSVTGSDAASLLSLASLCCDSTLTVSHGEKNAVGEPTENAIILAANAAGVDLTALKRDNPRLDELPFDSSRKLMTTLCKTPRGVLRITKGAPDVLLSRCESMELYGTKYPLSDTKRRELLRQNDKMAANALRVIAVAYGDSTSTWDMSERALTFAGLVGMTDPPRPEVKNAVRVCREAGITPVMITGDHVATAAAVANQIGIGSPDLPCVTGTQLDKMSDDELSRLVKSCRVYARVSPENKVRIVKALRLHGECVAMTGDGVNDAPALKAADIGCAMGKCGTDVAKGAADMILTDDNFATIVTAVAHGRGIYDNITKAVHFLLSSNIGEILVIFAASIAKMPAPLLPIQLLWVNLVTDSLPAMALGVEPPERDIMKRKPCPLGQSLFANGMSFDIAVEGFLVGALTLFAFVCGQHLFGGGVELGRTMAFAVLSLCEILHAVGMRSSLPLVKAGLFKNKKMVWAVIICTLMQLSVITVPTLSNIFKTVPLCLSQWLAVLALSLVPFTVTQVEKLIKYKMSRRKATA